MGAEPSVPDEKGEEVEEMERKKGQGAGKISVCAFAKLKRAGRRLWVRRPTAPGRERLWQCHHPLALAASPKGAGGVGPLANIMSPEDSQARKKEGGPGSLAAILGRTKLPTDHWEVGSRD